MASVISLSALRQLSPLCLLPFPSLPQFVLLHLLFPLSHHRIELHYYIWPAQRLVDHASNPRRRHHYRHCAQHALLHDRHACVRCCLHCSVEAGPASWVPRYRSGYTQPPRSQCPSQHDYLVLVSCLLILVGVEMPFALIVILSILIKFSIWGKVLFCHAPRKKGSKKIIQRSLVRDNSRYLVEY